ncbi:MAG TPA: hypothetical protein VMV97_13700 [Sulfuriferula sp.]|nr:hypothetical protein [Sulfuriferula sp.]
MAQKPWTLDAQHQTHHAYLSGEPIQTLANLFHQSVMFIYQADSAHRVDAAVPFLDSERIIQGIYLAMRRGRDAVVDG